MASSFLRCTVLLLTLHESAQGATTYAQMTTAANKTAINSYNSFMAKAMAALAKLAYCGIGPSASVPYGTEGGLRGSVKKSCGAFCTKAGFSLGKVELIAARDGDQENADFAYVARLLAVEGMTKPADCAVVIRGTWVKPANSDRNSQRALVDWPMPSCKNKGCKVHQGAKTIWGQIKGDIIDSLKGMQCQSLVVTGHSLGGQLAALAMFSLQDEIGFKVELSYTFEGSTPFNKEATEIFDNELFPRPISLFRITHTNDQVVMFPKDPGYLQPGSQVWFYGPGRLDYIHCGTVAQAPKCGVNGLPKDTLCSMSKNPAWKKCGGVAPNGGPHCTHPIAPAQNFCNMAGSSSSNFVGASLFTCSLGNGLRAQAQLPTISPQVFPIAANQTVTTAKPKETTTANELGGASFDFSMPSCWKKNTAYAPLGMLGKVMSNTPTMLSCQQLCAKTPYCEFASWWGLDDGNGGWCHLSGGWARQIAIAAAVSGPKDCQHPLTEESDISRLVNMEIMYLQSLSGSAPLVRFNERGYWRTALPGGFSLGSFVAFGASMLVIGSSATLLLSRVFGLRWTSRRAAIALSSSVVDYLEPGDKGLE